VTHAERQAALEAIANEVAVCTRCPLHEGRTKAVPGEGSASTEIMFVGEGPGRDEDAQGRPFVGESGKLLTRLIRSIGWSRDEVFITNVVKCRPPGNRDPQPDEISACAPFLRRQLDVLEPAVVVTLGRFSLGTFRPGERIGQAHGTRRPAVGLEDTGADAFAMYHPAFAVRDRNNEPTLFEDMARLPAVLVDVRRRRLDRESSAVLAGVAALDAGATAMPSLPEASSDAEPAASPDPAIEADPDPAIEPARERSFGPPFDADLDPSDQLPLF
jgi:uracil-DNA glycosylase family 4